MSIQTAILQSDAMLLENLLSSTNATSLSSTYISGIPVLAHACFMNKHAVTEILLEHKANPNVVVGDEPLLHIAYRISDKEILTLLLEHGAHPNAVDREYRTTLSKSIELEDQKERLELLISHGADVNAIDHRGRTPLHYATEDVNLVAVSTLLLHYADPDAIDKEGNTPLHLLPYYHAEIVQEFVDEFADFSLTNEKGSVEHYLCSMISSGKK